VTSDRLPRLERSTLVHPSGIALYEKPALGRPSGVVVCVHGALDRARSFARVARRLEHLDVIAYDRRGYEASQGVAPAAAPGDQAADLLATIDLVADRGPVSVLGHSMGGTIALAAAVADPSRMAALITYEAPLRWLIGEPDWWEPAATPASDAEAFFRMMTADGAWERLGPGERARRQADGPALVGDLTMTRAYVPFSLDDLARATVPITLGLGGSDDGGRFAQAAELVAAHAPDARVLRLGDLPHGAHLSAPDAVAALVLEGIARAEQIGATP
jgi:pimeloyl-ACP methyl ester carboxylesterase